MSGGITLPMLSVGPGSQSGNMPLDQHLRQLEAARGLPQGYLAQTRAVESSNGRNLSNPNSSARGPYQFIDSTANKMGLSMADRMDEFKSAEAAADLAASNKKIFENKFGRTPTGQDLYGMHQQGPTGYANLVNGQAPGGAAQSLNGGGGMSASQFLSKIHGIYNNAKPDLSGDPTAQAGGGPSANAPLPGAQGPTYQPTAQPAQDPSKMAYNGGLLGLLKGDDYTGQGSGKDLTGKLGDFTGSNAFQSGAKAIAGLFAPPQQTVRAPGIQPTGGDDVHQPNMGLLQMMMSRR